MRVYRGAYGVVGNVHAKLIVQRLEKLGFKLLLVIIDRGGGVVEGHVHHAHEEVRIVLFHKPEYLKMLVAAVHHLAGLGGQQRVEIIEAALNAALKYAARV